MGRLIRFSRPKITCEELDWSWKFYQYPFFPSKVIQLFNPDRQTDRHTDRHTDTRTPIHIRAGEIFLCLFLIPFTSLCSLCSLRSWRIIISKYPNTLGSTFGTKYFTSATSTVLLIFGDPIEKNQLMLTCYLDKKITSIEIEKIIIYLWLIWRADSGVFCHRQKYCGLLFEN